MNTRKRSEPCSVFLTKRKLLRCSKKLGKNAVYYCCQPWKKEGEGEGVGLEDDYGSKGQLKMEEAWDSRYAHLTQSPFDKLPKELLVTILAKVAASAKAASDFTSALACCRSFNIAGGDSVVLSQASSNVFAIGIRQWCDSARRFFERCANAGNSEACYSLGMIQFYCLEDRRSGVSFLAKAAMRSHSLSLYSLAIIQFNRGSHTKIDKDLNVGVAFCSRAAFLRNIDALRELGHCLQDGYGVTKDVGVGRHLLVEANARELAMFLTSKEGWKWMRGFELFYLLSDYGFDVGTAAHPVNRFLREWWETKLNMQTKGGQAVRLCSNRICGRIETQLHEFRRCSACCMVNYCSRACQAVDWKARHKAECIIPSAMYFYDAAG